MTMVLDRTTDGVLLSDADGMIVYASRPLLELFGYDAGDLVGQPLEILVPEYLREQHRNQVARFRKAPRPCPMGREDVDIEGLRADGSCFSIDVQLNALPGSSLIVATVRDMTSERASSVDRAIDKLDLTRANKQVDRLQAALDLVIQRLFGLGTSIAASASNQSVLSERMAAAVQGIDQIIEAVQNDIGRRVAPTGSEAR